MWKLRSASNSNNNPYLRSLNNHQGRQTWDFDESETDATLLSKVEELRANFTANRHKQKHSADELLRLQNADKIEGRDRTAPPRPLPQNPSPELVQEYLEHGISYYACLQADDGHFPGDYGGPMFLMPGLIIMLYTTGKLNTILSPAHQSEMIRYLRNHQNLDGGFGLHIEGHSTMFGTTLSYLSFRILGVSADDQMSVDARAWMHARGGAHHVTSWAKFWMAVLGVFPWEGMNPLPPEMWLLPHAAWTGIGWVHPGRYWCHCRMVYLPMSYVYGIRGTCKETELVRELREELYPVPYDTIDWPNARNLCCKEDLYYPHPFIQDCIWWTLYQFEPYLMGSWLRKKALAETLKHIHYEDENTRYVDIGPVNKAINALACWFEDPDGEPFKKHLARIYDYLWVAEDGMKMQGYNGSQLWDTAFAVQAIVESGLVDVAKDCLKKAHHYVDVSQVRVEADAPLDEYYRHISKGAWPFSTQDHGWPIADCSSEGLKAALALASLPKEMVGEPIPDDRLYECITVVLSYQNPNGGMATYENSRSFAWLEYLNPSETFGDIMIDYCYVELTSACVTALSQFARKYPDHRPKEIQRCIQRAEAYIRSIQRPDGSWYGNWAVCFTYGAWFGCAALATSGHTYANDDALKKACTFLLSKQKKDGGWGESYLSSQDKVYSQLEGDSHVVNTSWAMLALMTSQYHKVDPKPLHAAAKYLMNMQCSSGDWPQQHISGVFNRNCMITYANYRNIFPIWALGWYRRYVLLGEELEQ